MKISMHLFYIISVNVSINLRCGNINVPKQFPAQHGDQHRLPEDALQMSVWMYADELLFYFPQVLHRCSLFSRLPFGIILSPRLFRKRMCWLLAFFSSSGLLFLRYSSIQFIAERSNRDKPLLWAFAKNLIISSFRQRSDILRLISSETRSPQA